MDACQVCGVKCKPRRCTKCRKAFYCSVSCQSQDWKAGHRRVCRSQQTTRKDADLALQKLVLLTQNMSPPGIKEHHDRASDEVKRRELESQKKAKRRTADTTTTRRQEDKAPLLLSGASPVNMSHSRGSELNFDVVLEDMQHISRFQLTLQRRIRSSINSVDLSKSKVNFSTASGASTATDIEILSDENNLLYSATMPRLVEEHSARFKLISDDILQLSLTYKDDPTLRDMGTRKVLVSLEEINQIQCSSCKTPLLSENRIKRTSELPVGHWDDIADYLICYSGVRPNKSKHTVNRFVFLILSFAFS